MKNYRIIIILLCVFILSGCTFEYNIKINKNNIKETSSVLNYDKSTWNNEDYLIANQKYYDRINSYIKVPQPVYTFTPIDTYSEYQKIEGAEYYSSKIIETSDVYGMKYEYKHDIKDYGEVRIIHQCYKNVDVKNDDETFRIKTSEQFSCFEHYDLLDEVVINISTSWDYKVINSNADEIKDGKYTWIITKDNKDNKPINIEIKKVFNWRLMLIIAIPSLIVLIIVGYILRNKLSSKDNI